MQSNVLRAKLAPVCFATLIALGMVHSASAAITADSSAANQPGIHTGANGATVVDINKASAGGVSHNIYSEFNVDKNGVVLNNSTGAAGASTQLAGKIDANSNLAGKSATVILNEVRSADPSQLNGMVEVAGQSAKVIIANPSGITCDGCGFINADRATLTTGTVNIDSAGKVTGIDVKSGEVAITGAGMDVNNSGKAGYTDIIARSVKLNAKLQANNLNIITGANHIDKQGKAQAIAGEGAAPTLAVDVSALGSMYAGKINMIGTEQGVGVRIDHGDLTAKDMLSLTVDGKLENQGGNIDGGQSGVIEANQLSNTQGATIAGDNVQISATNELVNDAATIRAKGRLNIDAGSIENKSGGQFRSDNQLSLNTRTGGLTQQNGKIEGAGDVTINSSGKVSNVDSTIDAKNGSVYVYSRHDVNNQAGVISAGRAVTIDATGHKVVNDSGAINAKNNLYITADSISNRSGDILADSGIVNLIARDLIDNQGGSINNAGQTSAYSSRGDSTNLSAKTIDNRGGEIAGRGDVSLSAYHDIYGAGKGILNDKGVISADGALIVDSSYIGNDAGLIATTGQLTLNADSLSNTNSGNFTSDIDWLHNYNTAGGIYAGSAKNVYDPRMGYSTISAKQINNDGGYIISDSQTGSLRVSGQQGISNVNGVIDSQNELDVSSMGAINNNGGKINAERDLSLSAGALEADKASEILSGNDMNMYVNGVFANNGLIESKGRLNLNIQPANNNTSSTNKGTIKGGDMFISTTATFTNEGAIEAGRLNWTGNNIVNKGTLHGQTDIMLSGSTINNEQGATIAAEETISVNATKLTNAEGAKITGKTAYIYASQIDNKGYITPNAGGNNGGSDHHDGGTNNNGGNDHHDGGTNNNGGNDHHDDNANNGNANGTVHQVTYNGKTYSVGQVVNGQTIMELYVYPNGEIRVTAGRNGNYSTSVLRG